MRCTSDVGQEEEFVMYTASMAPVISRLELLEVHVRKMTHGRIRGFRVEESPHRVALHGRVPSRHARQLAIEAALEFLTVGEELDDRIVVG